MRDDVWSYFLTIVLKNGFKFTHDVTRDQLFEIARSLRDTFSESEVE